MGRCDLESETLIAAPHPAVTGITGTVAHTLTAEGFDASEDGTGRGSVIVATHPAPEVFAIQERAVCENPKAGPDGAGFSDCGVAYTLEARTVTQAVAGNFGVRRLTPPECHVLQGFPLDHCAIDFKGKPAADGPQCKALGNSIAVPVMRWLLDRARGDAAALSAYDFEAARAVAWGQA